MTTRSIWLGAAVAVMLASAPAAAQMREPAPDFDSAVWKSYKGKHVGSENRRAFVMEQVLALLKPVMTRQEVETLLGAPDEATRQFVYGMADGGDPKTSRTIVFDAGGKVSRQSPDLPNGVDGTGMTQMQVKAVAGEPNAIRDHYTYYLGTPGMAPDPEYLHVLFDAEGRLIRRSRGSG